MNQPAKLKSLCADLVERAEYHGTMKVVLWVASFGSAGTISMGERKVAARLGLAENTTRRAFQEATSKGWLELHKHGNTNRYRLTNGWLKTHQNLMQSDNGAYAKDASNIEAPTASKGDAVSASRSDAVPVHSLSDASNFEAFSPENAPKVASTIAAVAGVAHENAPKSASNCEAPCGEPLHVEHMRAGGDQSPLLDPPKEQDMNLPEGSKSSCRKSPKPGRAAPRYTPAFLAWWAIYPRKEAKAEAFEAWEREIAEADIADLMVATVVYAKSNDIGFLKYGVRFLKKHFWRDFVDVMPLGSAPLQERTSTDAQRHARAFNEQIKAELAKELANAGRIAAN